MERASPAFRHSPSPRDRQGAFVAVVGPSGAGKDTLINYARARLDRADGAAVSFVRRVITRHPDGSTEDHDSLSPEAFAVAEQGGAFALSWDAHGLRYGLPASIDAQIADGQVVVANVSRAAIPALRQRYRNVMVVLVTASAETLSTRLAARGRESGEEMIARLARGLEAPTGIAGAVTLVRNDGTVSEGGEALLTAIRAAADLAAAPFDI